MFIGLVESVAYRVCKQPPRDVQQLYLAGEVANDDGNRICPQPRQAQDPPAQPPALPPLHGLIRLFAVKVSKLKNTASRLDGEVNTKKEDVESLDAITRRCNDLNLCNLHDEPLEAFRDVWKELSNSQKCVNDFGEIVLQ